MKKDKILFVIPAYNEAENIEGVLKEIKRDVDYADILVIYSLKSIKSSKIIIPNFPLDFSFCFKLSRKCVNSVL